MAEMNGARGEKDAETARHGDAEIRRRREEMPVG